MALLAFLRISTKPHLFDRPLVIDEAVAQVEAWIGAEHALVSHPGPRHVDLLADLLADHGTGGNLVSDAHLAALALEHKAVVVIFDRDFGRFAGVRWSAPG